MKKRIINGYEAGKRIHGLWDVYANDLNAVDDLLEEKATLDEILNKTEVAAAVQSDDTTGVSEDKQTKKEIMAETIFKYALRGKVKAQKAGKSNIEAALNHPISYFMQSDAELAVARCTAAKKVMNDNLVVLTSITAANVTEMETSIANFQAVITTPQEIIDTKIVTGTVELNKQTALLDQTITNIGALIHSYYPKSELSKDFDLRSKLGETTTRHNHLIIHLEDSATQASITTAKGTIEGTDKTVNADEEGQIIFNTIRAGKRKIIIEAPGYTTQTITVYVRRSTTTEAEVELEKV